MCLAQLVNHAEKFLGIGDVLATIANLSQHIKILLLLRLHLLQRPGGFLLNYLADSDGNPDDVFLPK